MNYNDLPLSKASLRAKRKRRTPKVSQSPENGYTGNEAELQGQLDDALDALGMEYRRIPDVLWNFLKRSAPMWVVNNMVKIWRGKPDTMILIPVSDKYSLACEIELKSSKGKLSTRQDDYCGRMPVQVSRSPEKSMEIIEQMQADAAIVKGLFTAKNLNNI
jgi:hypothetical protein